MVKSMTGYGRGDAVLYNRKFSIEIKSLNHRYNDLNIKLPKTLTSFEEKIKSKLSNVIKRGKTDVFINLNSFSKDDIKVTVNEALSDSLYEAICTLKTKYNIFDEQALLSVMANFQDILVVERVVDEEKTINEIWEGLEIALDKAIIEFINMRRIEGMALTQDIMAKNKLLWAFLEALKVRSPLVTSDYATRLKTKITDALESVNYDENILIQEIAIFSDKVSIDEELTRLASHFSQIEEILREEDAIGKKLDFLVQEINREINTIGSKSNDIEITKTVIEMKSIVEKIREQIQNIE